MFSSHDDDATGSNNGTSLYDRYWTPVFAVTGLSRVPRSEWMTLWIPFRWHVYQPPTEPTVTFDRKIRRDSHETVMMVR